MLGLKTLAAAGLALFALAAPALAQDAAHDPAIGAYRFAGGHEAYIEYLPDIQGLAVMDFPAGRIRPLRRDGANDFSFGPTIGQADPVEARIEVLGDLIHWSEGGRHYTIGQRVDFPTEDVTLHNGAVTLASTLTLPRGGGHHPAIVLIHGGGAQTRDFFWVTHFFAQRGFAVLAYDKRGAGQSTGDWRTASFEDLAGDALTAVDYLRTRRDIRHNRIGLYGSSNGGWVAPIAAARAPDKIAFVIARSASALTERQNIVYEAEGDLRSHGFGNADVARMRNLHTLAIAAHDQPTWEALRTALGQAHDAPWFNLARLPGELPAWDDAHQADIHAFIDAQHRNETDPSGVWAQLHVPVFVQIGGLDRYVPGPESRNRIAAALAANRQARVYLYPRGDHPMFESTNGYERDIPGVSRYADGYLRDLDAFLRRTARHH